MYRRIGVLLSLAVVAAMSLGVTSAQAQQQGDVANCSFDGLSGQLTPAIPNPPGGTNQTGSYEFSGEGSCSGTWNGVSYSGVTGDITSNGAYRNIVCGTGWAADYSGANTHVIGDVDGDGTDEDITGVGYEIKFVAGHGALNIGGVGSDPFSPFFGSVFGGGWVGAGEIEIVPENANGCRTEPVQQFVVSGEFAAVHE